MAVGIQVSPTLTSLALRGLRLFGRADTLIPIALSKVLHEHCELWPQLGNAQYSFSGNMSASDINSIVNYYVNLVTCLWKDED